jgi:hypothetical protein
MAGARTQHGYVYSESKLVQHFLWTALVSRAVRHEWMENALSRLSLIPMNFVGES